MEALTAERKREEIIRRTEQALVEYSSAEWDHALNSSDPGQCWGMIIDSVSRCLEACFYDEKSTRQIDDDAARYRT